MKDLLTSGDTGDVYSLLALFQENTSDVVKYFFAQATLQHNVIYWNGSRESMHAHLFLLSRKNEFDDNASLEAYICMFCFHRKKNAVHAIE